MIISADNPIFPFIQFINQRSKQPIRNVISYDTITGEGVVTVEKTTIIPHLNNMVSVEFALHAETGEPLKGYFRDAKNTRVLIQLPELQFHKFHRYIQEIMNMPEHINTDKVMIKITKEYIDKPDKHVSS